MKLATTALAMAAAIAISGCDQVPYEQPTREQLAASPRLVFANYHPQYVISQDNAPPESDYYATEFLDPDGFNGAFRAFGGFMRDRPIGRDPLSGDWQLKDAQTDVARAAAAGLDGFIVDAFDLEAGWLTDRVRTLIRAAEGVPGFRIILQTDGAGGLPVPPELARRIHDVAASPAVYRLPGNRLVLSPWNPDMQGTAYWGHVSDRLASLEGAPPALVPTFLDLSTAQQWAPLVYGMGTWGGRSPATGANPYVAFAQAVHDLGLIWMQPVSVQDVRPAQQLYWESGNTENLRYTWQSAIDSGAEWVQIPTWNDYGEATAIAPSAGAGSTFLDLSTYYLIRYKLGAFPAIVRDAIYLVHRKQGVYARPDPASGNTKLMRPDAQSIAPRDTVEAISFLTREAELTVNVGSATYRFAAPAGFSTRTVPLGVGEISARAQGVDVDVAVTSPFEVSATPTVQDLQYRAVSSLR